MGEFLALLRREWLEHRSAFIWGPATVLGLMLMAGFMMAVLGSQISFELGGSDRAELIENLGTDDVGGLEALAAMALDAAGSTDAELEAKMDTLLFAIVQPFHLLLMVLVFFALIAALYDERKDHSVLFWKSMPVSDLQTVASKFVFAAWVAPVVTIAAICVAQLFAVLLASSYVEDGMGARVWAASDLWLRPIDLVFAYLLLGLWALPVYGWVLLVSAWAVRGPILWAIGVPTVAVLLEKIVLNTEFVGEVVTNHVRHLGLVYSQTVQGDVMRTPTIADRFALFGELALWLGIAVGICLLASTVYLRRHRNEI